MAGIYGSSTEDRYFERQLKAHLAQQDAAERRADMVEQRTKDLMQKGESWHPWTFENFEEAIGNAPEAQRKVMFSCIASAVDSGLNNDHANHCALVAVRQLVERYCTEGAAKAADAEDYE